MDDLHPTLAAVFREPEFQRRYDVASWKLLGEGAFSWVGSIRMRDLDSDVAVKVFKTLTQTDKRRIRQEVHNAQKIYSPGVVRVHTACFLGSHAAWLELELVEGHSLEDEFNARAGANAPFTFEEARIYGLAATKALAEAHAVGVIHRDIKPSNFLLPASKQPLVKLGDFGISKHEENSPLTGTGEFPGTPAYGAPETFDNKQVGAPADVYSLGLLLFRLFSGGHSAYDLPDKPSPAQLMNAHKNGAPRRLRDFAQDAPRDLEILFLRMLAKKPEGRPALDEVLVTLDRLGQASPAAGAPPPRERASRRGLVLGTAATLAITAGVLALYSPSPQLPPAAGASGAPAAPPTAPSPSPAALAVGAEPGGAAAAPTPPPVSLDEQFRATWLGEGSMTLTSTLDQPATINLAVPDTPHRCCSPAIQLDPRSSVLVWSARWVPPLPASPPVRAIQITGSSGSADIHTTIPVDQGVEPATPVRTAVPGPAIKARLDGASLAITNASRVHLADLRVALLGAGLARYQLAYPTVLAPGEELLLPIDGFQPPPPVDFRPLSADIRATSPKGAVSVQLPLR